MVFYFTYLIGIIVEVNMKTEYSDAGRRFNLERKQKSTQVKVKKRSSKGPLKLKHMYLKESTGTVTYFD